MTIISGFLGKYGLACGIVFSHIFLPIYRAQILIVTLAISVFSNTLIKMVLKEPRPFFVSDEFVPDKWEFEYGFPSGHSQTAVTFYLTVITLVFKEYNIQRGRYLAYLLVVFWCFTVGMTRVSLGVHTFEQILVGFGLGLIVHICTCHLFLKQLEDAFRGIETGKTAFFSKLFYMYIGFDFIVIILYNVNTSYSFIPSEWTKNIMHQCANNNKFISIDYESLNKQFNTSGKLGCYCAAFILRKFNKNDFKRLHIEGFKQIVSRTLINLCFGAVVSIPVLLVPLKSYTPVAIFFRCFLPTFSCGFLIVLCHNEIWRRFKVIK